MNKKILNALFSLGLFTGSFQASSITLNVMEAPKMDIYQWQAVNDLWHTSFYNAYKDLPFDQIDNDIKDASKEALIDFLQRLFDKNRLTALKDSYLFVLAYKNEKLAGYTLYHMLEGQGIIHIDHFAVDPNFQGQGIGKILLESTIKSKPTAIAVVLTTRIPNKQAQDFYKKQGFYELPSIDNLTFDTRYSMLLRKDIKPPSEPQASL